MSPLVRIKGRMAQADGSWHVRGDEVKVSAKEADTLVDLDAAEVVDGGGVELPDEIPADLSELTVPQLRLLAELDGTEIPADVKAKPAIVELVSAGRGGDA